MEEDSTTSQKSIEFRFPFLIVKTTRGISAMDRLSRFGIFKVAGWVSLFLVPILAAFAIFILLFTVSAYFASPAIREVAREIGPAGALLIPGLNPFLPLLYGWIGIFVGIVVHEGAHGVMARALNIPVKSAGLLLLAIIPVGAFVEIDDQTLEKARFRNAGRILASGSGSNMAIGFLSLLLMLLVVSSMRPIGVGAPIMQVFDDLPAAEAGIMPGDMILSINDVSTTNQDLLGVELSTYSPGDEVKVTVQRRAETMDFRIILAEHPQDPSLSFLGVGSLPVSVDLVLDQYQDALSLSPRVVLYLIFPTGNQFLVPFSDTMHVFYTSTIGDLYRPLANLFFWIWFINFNLGIFNALPIFPLDGGQAFRGALRASVGSRIGENPVKWITGAISLALVLLIISMFIIPYAGTLLPS